MQILLFRAWTLAEIAFMNASTVKDVVQKIRTFLVFAPAMILPIGAASAVSQPGANGQKVTGITQRQTLLLHSSSSTTGKRRKPSAAS